MIELMQIWAPLELEQALPLISGLFTLNNIYKTLCVVQGGTLTPEIIAKFGEVRNYGL